MISSSVCYDKNLYRVNGGHAILIDSSEVEEDRIPPSIQIKLDPSLQMEEGSSVTFRLFSAEDVSPWIHALSRCGLRFQDDLNRISFVTLEPYDFTHLHSRF